MMVVSTMTPCMPQTTSTMNAPGASKSAKSALKKKPMRKPSARPSLTPAELVEQARLKAIAEVELARERERNTFQLKDSWERIFEKYGKDFEGVADEIDIFTGEVCVDNGHLRAMTNASDKDSDNDGIDWSKLISPDKENRRRRNKRKRDGQDGGEGETGDTEEARTEGGVCGECPTTGHGVCAECGTPVPQLPSDEFVLAQLGRYGPAVLKALQNSTAKTSIQPSPPTSEPISSSRLAPSPSPDRLLSTSPAPQPVSSPLQARKDAPATVYKADTTPNLAPNAILVTASNTAPPKLGLRRKKPAPLAILDEEEDELSAPDTPTIASLSPFRKLSPISKAKAAIAAGRIETPTPRRGKTRLSIVINADESEDELSSTSANTPTISCTPTPLASKRPSLSAPSFKLPIDMSSQTPRPKPPLTSGTKTIPRRRAPTTTNVWAPRIDDPFYNPVWHDEHPDGTPQVFPSTPLVDLIFTPNPRIAESPIIRTPKKEPPLNTSPRSGRKRGRGSGSINVTSSKKMEEGEPVKPGWTSTPVRSNFGFLDFLEGSELEEPRRSFKITETASNPSPQRGGEKPTVDPSSKVNCSTTIPTSALPPNGRVTRSSPSSDGTELEVAGVVRKNGFCGEKKVRCDKFCFKCMSASELPI